jgi:hypothetical protein
MAGNGTDIPLKTCMLVSSTHKKSSLTLARYYTYDITDAPWLVDTTSTAEFVSKIGWMVEALAIDPFDSNHCQRLSQTM